MKEHMIPARFVVEYPERCLDLVQAPDLASRKKGPLALLTFGCGGQTFRDASARLKQQAENSNWFDRIYALTDTIDHPAITDLQREHGAFIADNPRGFGNWIWKPFLVNWVLADLPENAILFYCDAGCELSRFGGREFGRYLSIVERHSGLFFKLIFNEIDWCKADLLEKFERRLPSIRSRCQSRATFFFIKNTIKMRVMCQEWLSICCEDSYHYLDDSKSYSEEMPTFVEHRHDQAILSLLVKSARMKTIWAPDVEALKYYEANSTILGFPVHSRRNKSGESLVDPLIQRSDASLVESRFSRYRRMFSPLEIVIGSHHAHVSCLRWMHPDLTANGPDSPFLF
jgi:hypothetical protein